ncbi:MAG: hypothetical protein DRQ88_06525 [Epsilonproteobacteria bacterium]|nr:MAG: hypothetical protein DRQ89_04765 [Campylobacterota bacterium]RLA66452.1 MAG: hypothetical protein DRQ88_06525 [Campylobacterota bacterium]
MCNIGVGLRAEHYSYLEARPQTELKWFEVISENHLNSRGRPWEILHTMREKFPLSFHGVSLNIGSYAPLDFEYLKKLKYMIEVFDPFRVSDHLCFTGVPGANIHNLLPLPYNDKTLIHLTEKLDQVQSFLDRPFILENLSAYIDFQESTYTEWEFIKKLVERSGCKILLDVNNIYVNAVNHKFDPKIYIDHIPKDKIEEIHLAGYSDMGDFLFDTHSNPVFPPVWDLFSYVIKDLKDVPVLIEWDDDIPEFARLEAEALKAKKIWESHHARN